MSERLPSCDADAVAGRAELDRSTSPSRGGACAIVGFNPTVDSGAALGYGFPEPNQSVEATASRRDFERWRSDIERRIVCRRLVPVAVPHLVRWTRAPGDS
jgi:hypothetical protein